VLVAVLVFLGALCLLVSTVSVWIRDVALDEDVWADTSSQLLESENVRNALSVYIVDQAYSASSAEVRLEEALPPALKPLAPQIASQLRGIAYETASTALARPRVQELWRSTNRAANAQLVDLLEGNTERLRVTGNAVVLDLDQIVANVAGQIGLGSSATQTIQERVEPVVIMRSDQLSTAQTIVKALKALSFWPLILALALWAGAVYLAGQRRREPTFRDRPVFVHLMLAAALLLVFLWSPTGTPRRLITLVVVVILAFVGLEIFRRQSIREFPTALHEGGSSWSSWFGKGRMTDGSPAEAEPSARLERLERLAALHERGALTDKEYEAEKALAL
jgi:hypothetical protein